jgi:hypothetical protein
MRSVEQLHECRHVLLVLRRQSNDPACDELEERRVVRGHVVEGLGGIVVEVRSRAPNAPQR